MAGKVTGTADGLIRAVLDHAAKGIEDDFNADMLGFYGHIVYGVEELIRTVIEAKQERRDRLVVMVDTPGGYIEVTQRIVDCIRHFYKHVEFVVPDSAMSAGTVLVLSGDAIHMDYYSILGPIDPQILKGGRFIPALGYLIQYERLMKASRRRALTAAELAYLIERFDPAELYSYEQARELSVALIEEWLVKYKFKNWTTTNSRKRRVTPQMRKKRAREIASKLNDTERWHSHGRGIGIGILRNELKLVIEDFGQNPDRKGHIERYYQLLMDYGRKIGMSGMVHTIGQLEAFERDIHA